MKNSFFLLFCVWLFSCSEETKDLKIETTSEIETPAPNEYHRIGEIFSEPKVEIMEVSQSVITLNWFDPSNWQSEPEFSSQPEFRVESSTNPKFDNLVTTRIIKDSHQTTFSNLLPNTAHHFRVTALPPAGDTRYKEGRPATITVMTSSYPSQQVGGFSVSPEFGKAHFSWSEVNQPDPIDYVIHLLDDKQQKRPFREFITRGTEVRDVILQGGRTYWAQFRAAPAEGNDAFTTTDEITIEFEVPGNPLPQPQNISAIDRNGTLEVQWTAATSNMGEISYMINVKTGETLDQLFGDFVQKEAILSIPDAKPYGRYSFTIKCFPEAGNYSDLESLPAMFTFDYPLEYCPTPTSKPVIRPKGEPTSLQISLNELPDAPTGHRYEIEVASDPEFSTGLDRRTLEGNELDTVMTGRVPEEAHYIRIRMIGPEDDATIIASSWTDTVMIEAQPKPAPPSNPLP